MGSASSVNTPTLSGIVPGSGDISTSSSLGSNSMQRRIKVVSKSSFSQLLAFNVRDMIDQTVQKVSIDTNKSNTVLSSATAESPMSLGSFQEQFMDSTYVRHWLEKEDADELYQYFLYHAEKMRPKDWNNKSKYPLWCKYYGSPRELDGALALDRWGSYHESWLRLEEPPEVLLKCAKKMRQNFHLSESSINSFLVNFYYDGEHCYIPAHRDTTACLAPGSTVNCLSLGATREFVLCENQDLGAYDTTAMSVHKSWTVSHGDLFAIGSETNDRFLHAVPRDPAVKELRISIIFRSIDKSFLNKFGPVKEAVYASGKTRLFSAVCIVSKSITDPGRCEHIADLINEREAALRAENEKDLVPVGAKTAQESEGEREAAAEESKRREEIKTTVLNKAMALVGQMGSATRRRSQGMLSTVEEERSGMFTIVASHPGNPSNSSGNNAQQETRGGRTNDRERDLAAYYRGHGSSVPVMM